MYGFVKALQSVRNGERTNCALLEPDKANTGMIILGVEVFLDSGFLPDYALSHREVRDHRITTRVKPRVVQLPEVVFPECR